MQPNVLAVEIFEWFKRNKIPASSHLSKEIDKEGYAHIEGDFNLIQLATYLLHISKFFSS